MPELVLVDTDILVDVGRAIQGAVDFLAAQRAKSELGICSVTEMELIVGCRNNAELAELQKFLSNYRRVKLTEAIDDQAIEFMRQFRLSHGLLIPDAMIAATAMVNGIALLTKNRKHYAHLPGLNLVPYP